MTWSWVIVRTCDTVSITALQRQTSRHEFANYPNKCFLRVQCFRIFGLSCVCVSSVCSPGLMAGSQASDGWAGSDSGEAPGHSGQYPGPAHITSGPRPRYLEHRSLEAIVQLCPPSLTSSLASLDKYLINMKHKSPSKI